MPELVLPRRTEAVAVACEAVEAFAAGIGWATADVDRVTLATGEAVGNAVEHGGAGTREPIRLYYALADGHVELCVRDGGPGPNPDRVASARLPSDRLSTGGRGLFLLRRLADRVGVDSSGGVCLSFAPSR